MHVNDRAAQIASIRKELEERGGFGYPGPAAEDEKRKFFDEIASKERESAKTYAGLSSAFANQAQPKPISEVDQAVDALCVRHEELDRLTDDLFAKLASVLVPTPPKCEKLPLLPTPCPEY